MKKTLKEIFEQYGIYNDKGQLVPLLESELGKELFMEVEIYELNKSDVIKWLPSDEDINGFFSTDGIWGEINKANSYRREGAKHLRDVLKRGNDREC